MTYSSFASVWVVEWFEHGHWMWVNDGVRSNPESAEALASHYRDISPGRDVRVAEYRRIEPEEPAGE